MIMPIYEYQCQDCRYRFDKIQKISDAPLQDCPECGKPSLTKLVSAPSFRLKGTGWYETDFKNKGSQPKAEDNKDSSTTGTKTDKPAKSNKPASATK